MARPFFIAAADRLVNLPAAHLLLILLAGTLVYANTLHAPFQWDEDKFILQNPVVTDGVSADAVRGDDELFKMDVHRAVPIFTFRINFLLQGTAVEGYHVVNIAIHLLNALLVYALLILTFRTPFLQGTRLQGYAGAIAFCSALLFVVHPVQTEAVTYVHQRLASLAALFYLVSLAAFAQARISSAVSRTAWPWFVGSFLAAVLAMKSKENAFTLPLMIALYEFLFFSGEIKPRILRLVPFWATMLIIPVTSLSVIGWSVDQASRAHEAVLPRTAYLLTQFRVIITYLRLLVLPVDQNLIYDYPVFTSLLQPPVLLSFLALLAFAALAVVLLRRARRTDPALRIPAFGIFWFFLTLSVESSIIPIPSLINEYRLYLPSVGAFAAAVSAFFLLAGRKGTVSQPALRLLVAAIAVAAMLLGTATFRRNDLWNDRLALWQDTEQKSPGDPLPHANVGYLYEEQGDLPEAIKHYQAALSVSPTYLNARFNLGNTYLKIGMYREAAQAFQRVLLQDPKDIQARELFERSRALAGNALPHQSNGYPLPPR